MDRVSAWRLTFAAMALTACIFGPAATAADLPSRVTLDDGKGSQIELRLQGVVEGGILVSGFGRRRAHRPAGGQAALAQGETGTKARHQPLRLHH